MTVVSYLERNNKSGVMVSDGCAVWDSDVCCYLEPKLYKSKVKDSDFILGTTGDMNCIHKVMFAAGLDKDEGYVNTILERSYLSEKEKYFTDWSKRRATEKGKKITPAYRQKLRKKFEKDDVFGAGLLCFGYDKILDDTYAYHISENVTDKCSGYVAIGSGCSPSIRSTSMSINQMLRDERKNLSEADAVRILLKATLFAEGSGVGGEPQVMLLNANKDEPIRELNSLQVTTLYGALYLEINDAIKKDLVYNIFERIVTENKDPIESQEEIMKSMSKENRRRLLFKRF